MAPTNNAIAAPVVARRMRYCFLDAISISCLTLCSPAQASARWHISFEQGLRRVVTSHARERGLMNHHFRGKVEAVGFLDIETSRLQLLRGLAEG